MDAAQQATAALERLRAHRAARQPRQALDAAAEAVQYAVEAEDHDLIELCCWRHSKAAADFGEPAQVLGALAPALETGVLFTTSAAPLDKAGRVLRAHVDQVGYAHPVLPAYLAAWRRAHERAGQPFLAGIAMLEQAWVCAVRGRREALTDLLDEWLVLTPGRFGSGPFQHPEAPDAASSVFWLQRDLCVHVLYGACFSRDAGLAEQAQQGLDEVFEEAGPEVQRDPGWLAARARTASRFGSPDAAYWAGRWSDRLAASTSPRAGHDRAVARALTTGDGWREAAVLAEQGHFGWEWVVDARLEAGEQADELVERYGLDAFRRPGASKV